MAKKKKTDQDIVKKAESEDNKTPVSNLQVHTVEPVVKPQNKGKKPKGEITNGRKETDRKTNAGTIKEVEKKPEAREEAPVPVPPRRRGYFDWFTDGGKERGDR